MTKVIVVYTKQCPYCPPTKKLWTELKKRYKFSYEEVDATSERGKRLVDKYMIMAVPTTIIDNKVAFVGVPEREKAIEAITCH
jgi:glutaredoxin